MIYAIDFAGSMSDILAEFLLDKFKLSPFDLAHVQVILPTRYACKILKESFFKKSQNAATLLPQMVALYDIDDLSVDLPKAISDWERLFLLTKLCQAKPNLKETNKAFQVAHSLAQLLDLFYQYNVTLDNIIDLVPDSNLAQHWQETITFLNIIKNEWPKILKEYCLIDKQDRLQRIIRIKAKEIQSQKNYVVIAGLTANLPAIAELMKSSKLCGDIFLDGVDKTFILSNQTANKYHPQYQISKTLKLLEIPPEKIIFKTMQTPKEEFVEQAFRSDVWQKSYLDKNSVSGLKCLLSETAEQEALSIALLLRQVLETPDKTACLVTTDRNLSRRVIAQMKRWNICLDDSAGLLFKHTSVGSFLLQILELAQNNHINQRLSLYKHPLFSDGKNPTQLRNQVKQEEKEARVNHKNFNLKFKENGNSFFKIFKNNKLIDFSELLKLHIKLAEKWATTDTQNGTEILWNNPLGYQLHQILIEILDKSNLLGKIRPSEYTSLFTNILESQMAHLRYGYQKRIKILGHIQARFSHTDLCIIGGLNEQIFPPVPDTGPWLNRSMLNQLGLPDAEELTTNLAHDFMHLATSNEVVLSRCLKVSGTPTVASRFLQRLQMVAQANEFKLPTFYSHLAELVDIPEKRQLIVRPSPCPRVDARPKKLSVTSIELLKKNPYAIYAKYILSLYPLDNWDNPAKASLYGQSIHNTLSHINDNFDDKEALTNFRKNLIKTHLPASDCLFYESLFKNNIWPFFKEQQNLIKSEKCKTYTEIEGEIHLKISGSDFTLTSRVDRIDMTPEKTATIIDYKTGIPPSFSKVISGLSPQLTLEALMLLKNGFKNLKAHKIKDIEYWYIGRHPKCQKFIKKQNEALNDVIQKTEDGVIDLLTLFSSENMSYEVEPIKDFAPEYDDYAHLSRKKEWAHTDEGNNDA